MLDRGALFSECGKYRYALWRRRVRLEHDEQGNPGWPSSAVKRRTLGWVMLNPSSAAEDDDPTIRKCMGFAYRGGYDGIVVVNLFAFKATDPRELWKRRGDIVGPDNNNAIERALTGVDAVMFAWGAATGRNERRLMQRAAEVTDIVLSLRPDVRTFTLGRTAALHPRHPLYVSYSTQPETLHEREHSERNPWSAGGEPPGPRYVQRQLELGDAT